MSLIRLAMLAPALALSLSPPAVQAQAYPVKPVRVIVPYGPGSATDFVARTLTDELRIALGQPFVTEYKPGGDAVIGTLAVMQSPADGYTLLLGTNGSHAANAYLKKDLPYDPVKDFAAISYLVSFSSVVAVNPALPIATVKDLIAYAKAHPGKTSYAYGNTIGRVTFNHLFRVGGVKDVIGVPYKSNPLAVTDVMAGVADMTLVDLATGRAVLGAGKLKPVAGARMKRSSVMPDVPAISETPGFEGFDIRSWVGLFGPAATPRPVVELLNATIRKSLGRPEVQKRFQTVAAELEPGSVEDFQAHVRQQVDVWRQRLRDAGIEPE